MLLFRILLLYIHCLHIYRHAPWCVASSVAPAAASIIHGRRRGGWPHTRHTSSSSSQQRTSIWKRRYRADFLTRNRTALPELLSRNRRDPKDDENKILRSTGSEGWKDPSSDELDPKKAGSSRHEVRLASGLGRPRICETQVKND